MLQLTCTALDKDREVCLVMFYEEHVESSTVSILMRALLSNDAIKQINTVIEQRFVHDNIITHMSKDTRVKVRVKSHLLYDTTQGFL